MRGEWREERGEGGKRRRGRREEGERGRGGERSNKVRPTGKVF